MDRGASKGSPARCPRMPLASNAKAGVDSTRMAMKIIVMINCMMMSSFSSESLLSLNTVKSMHPYGEFGERRVDLSFSTSMRVNERIESSRKLFNELGGRFFIIV